MIHNIDWTKSHCGVMVCSFEKTIELMPEVEPVLKELYPILDLPLDEYVVDIRVSMLMPKQYAAIPNWHRDFVPRDADLVQDNSGITGEKMYMWLSGTPSTEYLNKETKETYVKSTQMWHAFTQDDWHRAMPATEHCWRGFIRVVPSKFIHGHTTNLGTQRRHSQVYLDTKTFKW